MSEPSAHELPPQNRGVDRDDRANVLAFAALAAALLVRYLLAPWFGEVPFATLYVAVAAAVWLGGYRPAIVVTIVGYLASLYLIGFAGLEGIAGLIAYLSTSAIIMCFGEAARAATGRETHQRELFRLALASSSDAVITTDDVGRVESMNAVAEALTGWTEQHALRQPIDAVLNIANAHERPAGGPEGRNVSVLIRRDGTECEIDQSATPIRGQHGEVSGCLLVFRDLTDQRRAERARASDQAATHLLASIVDSSNDAIIAVSLDGTIRSWNAAAESLYGHTPTQAIGTHISLVIPHERRSEENAIIARISSGQRVEHFVTERLRSDGARVLVSLTVSPIRNEHGHVIGASKIARDVTEHFAAAERERELQAKSARLAADLARVDRRKDEFIASLAHELRTPLAAIGSSAKALRMGSRDEGVVQSASRVIERQTAQLSRLVEDLLDVSRIAQGKVQVRKRRIELAPVVEQALESVRAYCAGIGHDLSVELPQRPIYLDADPVRLTQVVANLVHNACKFTGQGGLVAVRVSEEEQHAVIGVRDTGIGIPGEFLPRLFDTFAQVETTPGQTRDGLGLGLPLVKSFVDLHGGTIAVRSDGPGRGAEFTVRIPTASTPAHWQLVP